MAHELSGEDGSASLRAGRQAAQKAAGRNPAVSLKAYGGNVAGGK